MKRILIIISLCVVVLSACKKDWTCECENSNGKYNAGEVTATKTKAKKHCESLSNADTKCGLK
jgi:hypothetical protein